VSIALTLLTAGIFVIGLFNHLFVKIACTFFFEVRLAGFNIGILFVEVFIFEVNISAG
jgi:hypothetical protein